MKENIKKCLAFLETARDNLVIDADTHISDTARLEASIQAKYLSGENYYHGKPVNAEDLLKGMKQAGGDMCLCWQNPAATFYPGDEEGNYLALYRANQYISDSWEKSPEKFIPAGWTDPKALGMERAIKLTRQCVQDFGFPIVKLNPAQNRFPIDSSQVIEIVDEIIELGAIPAFHYGADTPFTPAKGLEKVARHLGDRWLIAVHMGGGGASYNEAEEQYQETRLMGLENPNIKFVMSARRDTHIESDLITYQLAGEPFKSNLCCASDAPYGNQSWNFGGYRAMFASLMDGRNHPDIRLNKRPDLFDEDSVRGYLGGNFARIAIRGLRNIT